MRIATGVLLIIAALLNLFASFGYIAGGGLATGASALTSEMSQAALQSDNSDMSPDEKAALEKSMKELEAMEADTSVAGSGLMLYGIFLLVSVGILISGAVFLFKDSNSKFVLFSGATALAAEGISIVIVSFGVMNIIGLVAGTLALVTGRSMSKRSDVSQQPV